MGYPRATIQMIRRFRVLWRRGQLATRKPLQLPPQERYATEEEGMSRFERAYKEYHMRLVADPKPHGWRKRIRRLKLEFSHKNKITIGEKTVANIVPVEGGDNKEEAGGAAAASGGGDAEQKPQKLSVKDQLVKLRMELATLHGRKRRRMRVRIRKLVPFSPHELLQWHDHDRSHFAWQGM